MYGFLFGLVVLCLNVATGFIVFVGWLWPSYAAMMAGGFIYSSGSVLVCIGIAYAYYAKQLHLKYPSNCHVICYILYALSLMGVVAYWVWRCIQPPTTDSSSYNNVFWGGIGINISPCIWLLPGVFYDLHALR